MATKNNPNFKRKFIREADKPNLSIKYQEHSYLKRWVKQQDINYLQKFKNVPELIRNEYEKHLKSTGKQFERPFTKEERLWVIRKRLDWLLHYEQEFKHLRAILQLTQGEFSQMFGYSSPSSFGSSTAKVRIMTGVQRVLEHYDSICYNPRFKPLVKKS